MGRFCEIDVDDCVDLFCYYGGICIDRVNGFFCICKLGYIGSLCDVNYNECGSSFC